MIINVGRSKSSCRVKIYNLDQVWCCPLLFSSNRTLLKTYKETKGMDMISTAPTVTTKILLYRIICIRIEKASNVHLRANWLCQWEKMMIRISKFKLTMAHSWEYLISLLLMDLLIHYRYKRQVRYVRKKGQ